MNINRNLIRIFSFLLSFILILSLVPSSFAESESAPDAEALLSEGWKYFLGDGVDQDIPKGVSMVREAADRGSTEAMLRLGYLCAYGYGNLVEENYVEGSDADLALGWFNKVAELGNTEMATDKMIDVGYAYLLGTEELIPENTANSLRFFERAEQLGNYAVNSILGIYYTYGAIVERSPERALELFVEGARAGLTDCALAIEEYAYSYYTGNDEAIDMNFETAFKYYEALTEFNNTRAMYNLGLLYIYGLGVSPDHDKGVEWITKAADLGDEVAKEMLNLI